MNEPANDGSSMFGRAAGTAMAFGAAASGTALSVGAGSLMVGRAIRGGKPKSVAQNIASNAKGPKIGLQRNYYNRNAFLPGKGYKFTRSGAEAVKRGGVNMSKALESGMLSKQASKKVSKALKKLV